MNRSLIAILGAAILAGAASGQNANQPIQQPIYSTPPAYNPYPYSMYGGGHASTLEEGSMNGMANMMSARGSYNLQTSQAAVNLTQAQSADIANHQQYTNTYFQMQATNQAARDAKNPRPTMEQLVRVAREGAPKPISPSEVDPVTGEVAWPALLQYPDFEPQRKEISTLLQQKAEHGGLGFAETHQFIDASETMAATLKKGVNKVTATQYAVSKNFIKSLLYSTCQVALE